MSRWPLCLVVVAACLPAQVRTTERTFLRVSHQRQDVNLCVPTSAAMILAYYGEEREPAYLKSLATPPESTFAGTYFKDMVNGVGKLGYSWRLECFSPDQEGFRAGVPKLKKAVFEGHPVMVGMYEPPIGHTVVMVGYDEASKELSFIDPYHDSPGLRTMDEDDFRIFWRENIAQVRCAVFTAPRPR
jgi:hypothetical protein